MYIKPLIGKEFQHNLYYIMLFSNRKHYSTLFQAHIKTIKMVQGYNHPANTPVFQLMSVHFEILIISYLLLKSAEIITLYIYTALPNGIIIEY